MKLKKLIIKSSVVCLVFLSFFSLSHSQSQPAQPTLETPKPLELPNFIIEGVEQLNVRSGIKQMPSRTYLLNSFLLDSLNSLEKQSAVLIAPDPLPSHSLSRRFHSGFLKGSLGLFGTPDIEAGYRKNWQGYELFANAGYNYSGGDVNRSDYQKLFLKAYSDFIAPEKYFLFGGSRTRTSVFVNNSNYNLYANALSQQENSFYDISATKFGVNIETDGSYRNVSFNTGVLVNSLQLASDENADYIASRKAFDNNIKGFLKVKSMWNNYLLAGNVLLDFHSLRSNAVNFLQLDGQASFFTNEISFLGGLGFQSTVNSASVSRGGLFLKGEVEYRMSQLITIKGSFTSGLENNTFSEYFAANPYLNFQTPIDFVYNIALINGSILLHPTEQLTFSGGLKWRIANRLPFFDDAGGNTFTIAYDDGTVLEIIPEIIWEVAENSRFTANMAYTVSSMNNFNGNVPYYPALKFEGSFRQLFFEKLGTQIGLVYIGERDVSVINNDKIDGYIDLNVKVDYNLNNNFLLFVNFHNLTSSNIYIWNNYKERGLFANLGLLWQF